MCNIYKRHIMIRLILTYWRIYNKHVPYIVWYYGTIYKFIVKNNLWMGYLPTILYIVTKFFAPTSNAWRRFSNKNTKSIRTMRIVCFTNLKIPNKSNLENNIRLVNIYIKYWKLVIVSSHIGTKLDIHFNWYTDILHISYLYRKIVVRQSWIKVKLKESKV